MPELKYPEFNIPTNVVVDRPTINNNIYTKSVVAEAIDKFNFKFRRLDAKKAQHATPRGGILNRTHIQITGEHTHEVRNLYIDDSDDRLYAKIRFITECGQRIQQDFEQGNIDIIAMPIISIPSYIYDREFNKNGYKTIDEIIEIIKIQIECHGT